MEIVSMTDNPLSGTEGIHTTDRQRLLRFLNALTGYEHLLYKNNGNLNELAGGLVHQIHDMLAPEGPCHVDLAYCTGHTSAGTPIHTGISWSESVSGRVCNDCRLRVTCAVSPDLEQEPAFRSDVQKMLQTMLRRFFQSAELLQTLRQTEQSESRYRRILDNLPILAFHKDVTGRYQACNQPFAEALGKTPQEIIGRTDEDLLTPDQVARNRAQDQSVLATGNPQEWELEGLTGKKKWVKVVKIPTVDDNDTCSGILGLVYDITTEKRQKIAWQSESEALKHSLTATLRKLDTMEQLPGVGTWEWDITRNRIAMSQQSYALYGTSPDTFDHTPEAFAAFVHPEDRSQVEAAITDTLKGHSPRLDHRIVLPNGKEKVIRVQLDTITDKKGNPVRLIGSVQDVTEQLHVEQTLETVQKRYDAIFSRSSFALFIHDLKGRFIDANPAALKLTGYTEEEITSISLQDLLIDDDLKRAEDNMTRLFRDRQLPHIPQYRIRTKQGETRWVLVDPTPLVDRHGRPEAVLGIVKDITEQVNMQNRITGILNATADGVIEIDTDGNTVFANRAACEMLGYTEKEMTNHSALTVWNHGKTPGEHRPEDCPICESLKTGTPRRREHDRFRRKDGSFFPVSLDCTPTTQNGASRGIVVTFRDLTEHDHLESQVRQSQKLEAIGQLAGGVAHDFNNVLTAISGFTELALLKSEPDHPLRPYLEQVHEAAGRGANLTRQLLAFSRKEEIRPEVLDLNEILRQMHTMLSRLIGEDIQLSLELDDTIPSIQADPGQIEQIVVNLVINARDAIQADTSTGKSREIAIQTSTSLLDDEYCRKHEGATPGRYVLLIVRDTGCGMGRETTERIFEPFFTTKEAGKGTGLGLATCFGVVKQNRGSIFVYSEPGIGTTFKIYWPVYAGTETAHKHDTPALQRIAPGTGLILVVEDDPAVRSFVSEGLSLIGFDTLQAASGEDALAILDATDTPVDLVFSDVVMEGMDGIELLKKIRTRWPGTAALLASGYSRGQYDRIRELPAVTLIPKPYDMQTIARAIRELIGHAEN